MIVEQPGDREDLSGRPFIGPAGKLLDKALEEVGLDRAELYLTNAVKHFKFTQQGLKRVHKRASPAEIHHCKPWVLAEIAQVRPKVIVLLGATAAKALLSADFSLLAQRGLQKTSFHHLAPYVIATIHPSYLLRLSAPERSAIEYQQFLKELETAKTLVQSSSMRREF